MYATGNIAGPFFFRDQDAPEYVLAITAVMVCFVISVFCAILLRIFMVWENRRRDTRFGKVEDLEVKLDGMRMGMYDKTDNENKDFRYVL